MSDPLSVKPRHANVPGRGATGFITGRRIGDMNPRSRRNKRQGGEVSFLPAMSEIGTPQRRIAYSLHNMYGVHERTYELEHLLTR